MTAVPLRSRTGIAPCDLRESELYGILTKASGETNALSDQFIHQKLRAAEDHYQKLLGVFLGETRISSEARARVAAGQLAADAFDLEEPGYDIYPNQFGPDRWGGVTLNYGPVASVTRLQLRLPGSTWSGLDIPTDWLVVDPQSQKLEIVPYGLGDVAIQAQLGQPMRTYFWSASRIPRALVVDYVAGYSPAELRLRHADLLEGLRIRAALNAFGVLTAVRTGGLGSQSLSIDGLSRSENYNGGKYGPYSGVIEQYMAREKEILDAWRGSQRGVLLA